MAQQNPTDSNTAERMAGAALAALETLLTSHTTPPAVRLRAAQAALRSVTRSLGRPTVAARDLERFDRLCLELAPHQALQRLGDQ